MGATNAAKRQRLLLDFIREQTCDGDGFDVELEVEDGTKVTAPCLELFVAKPEAHPKDYFESERAKKLCQKIKKDYGIVDENLVRASNNRITFDPPAGASDGLRILNSDLEKLRRDGCISFRKRDCIHNLTPKGRLEAGGNWWVVSEVHVEAEGDAWLEQKWVHRFCEKHPLLVKLNAPALVLLGAGLGEVVPKLVAWLWPLFQTLLMTSTQPA